VAPVALYPDPLLAVVLAASAFPVQVEEASAFLVRNQGWGRVAEQPWDASVRALCHYPPVLTWMAQNGEWTQALGHAVATEPGAVLDAVQRVRARAVASHRLVPTLEQNVVSLDGEIEIIPAEDGSLYAPGYDADSLASDGPADADPGSFLEFGPAYPAGGWLTFSFDWGQRSVWTGDSGTWISNGSWKRTTPRLSTGTGGSAWTAPAVPPAVNGSASPRPTARSAVVSGTRGAAPSLGGAAPAPGSSTSALPRPRLEPGEAPVSPGANPATGPVRSEPPSTQGHSAAQPPPPSPPEGRPAPKADPGPDPRGRDPSR
jgi:hypothetical protein